MYSTTPCQKLISWHSAEQIRPIMFGITQVLSLWQHDHSAQLLLCFCLICMVRNTILLSSVRLLYCTSLCSKGVIEKLLMTITLDKWPSYSMNSLNDHKAPLARGLTQPNPLHALPAPIPFWHRDRWPLFTSLTYSNVALKVLSANCSSWSSSCLFCGCTHKNSSVRTQAM